MGEVGVIKEPTPSAGRMGGQLTLRVGYGWV